MKVTLNLLEGPGAGRKLFFTEPDTFLVGRSKRAHLRLGPEADRYLSRTHFILEIRSTICIITDLNSTNGTLVNDKRIHRMELFDGDLIRVGNTLIQVNIDEDETEKQAVVLCTVCGRNVTDEVGTVTPEQSKSMVYTCNKCQKQQQELKRRATLQAEQAKVTLNFKCVGCQLDLSEAANSDGCAADFPDMMYLCDECAQKQQKPPIPYKTMGDYTVLSELGKGAMGIVFKVVHNHTRRICAIKQIHADAVRHEDSRKLFEREMEVQSMVAHPNLVRNLGKGLVGNVPFFVTEFLPGGDISQLMRRVFRGPLPVPLAVRITLQLLKGLSSLHSRGFIHRDLKPSNFLLSRPYDDPDFVAKISDYGLAKSYEDAGNSLYDYTQTGKFGGSLLFMPPEQITNYKFVKPPSDVYAIGVSLYFLLTGKYTIDVPKADAQKHAPGAAKQRTRHPVEIILEDSPIPIMQRKADLLPQLAEVVDKAVMKEADKRYQTADEFREALKQVSKKYSF
ncbi:MAG: protein kinase [Nitrospirae bacterium]|uniref:FHA domain-containing serine/threonine-protein kinase n=1 Tax=Candidatus Magnetobacterium casense TaxID=1455061 RepID=UPI0005914911|nr:FHA domain-containing serine/threonine-protein kinase [Candidatus Magnetobacterium casensis]MBF0336253.1 protein kinase [Nitrospirota bacterium]